MERKYLEDMIAWNNSESRKPLIVWGARQVGKTYLIKEMFAEKYYGDNYVYIDCSDDYKFCEYCNSHPNSDEILTYISMRNKRTLGKDTLIIFDEVQECIPLVSMLKQFQQNHNEIPIVVTGSMVRIKIKRRNADKNDKGFLFPIGKIDQITVFPLTFDEYLINRNKNLYEMIKISYRNKKPLEKTYHEMALKSFYEYVLIGGMPEAVNEYITTNDFNRSRAILSKLYDSYLLDMDLYQASKESIVRSRSIFSKIYSQLNTDSRNFKPSSIQEGTRTRDIINPINWLIEAHIVQISKQLQGRVTIPLIQDENGPYRLFLCDMGLFTYQSGVEATTFIDEKQSNMLSGIFYENYVAIELASRDIELYNWKGKNNAEFEFVTTSRSKVIPIDVKRKKGTLNSLEKFKDNNEFHFAIKVSANNYGYDDSKKILTIPFYEFPFVADDFANNNEIVKQE